MTNSVSVAVSDLQNAALDSVGSVGDVVLNVLLALFLIVGVVFCAYQIRCIMRSVSGG